MAQDINTNCRDFIDEVGAEAFKLHRERGPLHVTNYRKKIIRPTLPGEDASGDKCTCRQRALEVVKAKYKVHIILSPLDILFEPRE